MTPAPSPAARWRPNTRVSDWLVDEYVESYVRWREESIAVHAAYERCQRAERSDRALAFAACAAALDREECAARTLAECADRISRQLD
ncbi:MAG: hypothetical protein JO325_05870 [Solirubrobacterales bacterium]|nr:hypothetical protein [Solirubrobacterales bacterium]